MADTRLEQILANLARRYAPELLPPAWRAPGDYPAPLTELATALAGYNVLVMSGDVPSGPEAEASVKAWVESYVGLYDLLARPLFPSFTTVSAYYADTNQPPIVFINGAATPVIIVLAGYIAPYVASRQGARLVSDFELVGLMNIVLDELEAGDLPYDQQRQLRDDGVNFIRQMLSLKVRQRALTQPRRGLANAFDLYEPPSTQQIGGTVLLTAPASMPEETPVPPPAMLPEENAPAPPDTLPTETPNPFASSIPIFFEPKSRGKRRPPVPDLPDDLK